MDKTMNNWSQQELIAWIKTLSSISKPGDKQKIIDGINAFQASGQDVFDADKDDLSETFEINGMLALKLFKAIQQRRGAEFRYHQPGYVSSAEGDATFTLNLTGQNSKLCKIDKLKSSHTIKQLKQRYLEEHGKDLNQYDKITIVSMGKPLLDNKTLAYYKLDSTKPLTVVFRVKGGSEHKEEHRIRRLRHKQYKKQIILSNDPDCIMGYTNKDGIKRAEMPCGCAFAADTMYRFMKAAFEKEDNFRSFTMQCPMPRHRCKGTTEAREWDWSLVFIIADLSQNEKTRYSRIINNRIAGIKCCPHCGANCERPKDLRIYRVRCKQCDKADWCWECRRVWKGAKTTATVCGNGNCIADRLNAILRNTNIINEERNGNCKWASGLSVPDIRHCPKCFTIIEYVKDCPHMKCTGCPYEFCFMCLSQYKCTNCKVAPIQQIV